MSTSYVIHPIWIYMASACGIFGTCIITLLAIHVIYHEQHNMIGTKLSRVLSFVYYASSLMSCVAYGFFRTNVVFPMGISIDCRFGYFLMSTSIFMAKLSLYTIFLHRIHMVFGSSPLRYPPKRLIGCWVSYVIGEVTVCLLHSIIAWDLVHLQTANDDMELGICTTLTDEDMSDDVRMKKLIKNICIGILSFGDVAYSVFVCSVFVHKLIAVSKMTNDQNENREMLLVSRRKTILVLIACITSFLTMGMSAVVSVFGYLISIDIITNAICVWLMYSFNKRVWNMCDRCICCCCYCDMWQEDTTATVKRMHSTSVHGASPDLKPQIKAKGTSV